MTELIDNVYTDNDLVSKATKNFINEIILRKQTIVNNYNKNYQQPHSEQQFLNNLNSNYNMLEQLKQNGVNRNKDISIAQSKIKQKIKQLTEISKNIGDDKKEQKTNKT